MSVGGGCLCGRIQYTLEQQWPGLDMCYCKNCQCQSGAAVVPFLAIPLTALQLAGTSKTSMDDDTESGKPAARHFCEDSGSPFYVVVGAAPNTAYIALGMQDDTHDLISKCHGWRASKQDGVPIVDSAPQHEFETHLEPEFLVTE